MINLKEINERGRVSFEKIPHVLDIPDLIEVQRKFFNWFMQDGIKEVLEEISPIKDFTNNLSLEFKEHRIGTPKYTVEECRERDMTYAVPLKVKVNLIIKEENEIKEIKEQEIYLGDFPLMTEKGTFVVNGAERVVVSQLVRSPGVYFENSDQEMNRINATIIPNRGARLEFEADVNDTIGVRIDMTRKIPVTILLKALGYTEDELKKYFNNSPLIVNTLDKDGVKTEQDALIEIYRKQRPGDPPTASSAKALLNSLFFDKHRYDLARVGRYKLIKKLRLQTPCPQCGAEGEAGEIECAKCSANLVYERVLNKEDIMQTVLYLIKLFNNEGTIDDIDHLGNRRVRSVGELLQNQFRVGMLRLERVIKERMTVHDLETVTPQALINIRPVVAAIKEFFGSSQLSQFMDQTNFLAELTHKRRLSALGPGGLSRERAGFKVRDVHHSHYGRICPIETPEGPNIGLIGSLASYARINEYGFIETPYRKVTKGVVSKEIAYLTADEEDRYYIAQANVELDSKGKFVNPRVRVRYRGEVLNIPGADVDFMDVSPKQLVSVATALIPFLEHDDANRALMGANMQRQAVPLIKPESPLVGTGMEYFAARYSGGLIVSQSDGIVKKSGSDKIIIEKNDKSADVYNLVKYARSNSGTCINQRPIVKKGTKIKKGQVIADGFSSVNGELALGKNVLVAFMPWEGYNYEDAILISEELVKDDTFTSIHIEEYEAEARDTKLGPEEITRDIPNVSEDSLKDLDERGIARIGAEVRAEDILVGKVTPKGETELTAEERLLRAIFGEKARDVRDTSLRVPHGEKGKVIDVKHFSSQDNEELAPGINQLVRVYVAQKRKILQGDKIAGRHGNKGVIAKILPVEDMPFLPDGTPIQIVLNPLGVPSRMNIGQVFETHLGAAAYALGLKVETPVFDGAKEPEVFDMMKKATLSEDGKACLRDGRTGDFFQQPITVGYIYMMKLAHLVDDKIHARSTGPYSLVTQQPLGGKAQFGGQRFGEMEVWALEAYGAAYTLQELLTIKSDDVVGRVKTYEAIIKGENVLEPGVPESFKVLIKELQSLALDVQVIAEEEEQEEPTPQEIELEEDEEEKESIPMLRGK